MAGEQGGEIWGGEGRRKKDGVEGEGLDEMETDDFKQVERENNGDWGEWQVC